MLLRHETQTKTHNLQHPLARVTIYLEQKRGKVLRIVLILVPALLIVVLVAVIEAVVILLVMLLPILPASHPRSDFCTP